MLVFCLRLIKWQASGKAQSPLLQTLAPGSAASATHRPPRRRYQRPARLSHKRQSASRAAAFIARQQGEMWRGESRDSELLQGFPYRGQSNPSGPHPRRPDYSRHYKGDENNSRLKATVVFFSLIYYYFTVRKRAQHPAKEKYNHREQIQTIKFKRYKKKTTSTRVRRGLRVLLSPSPAFLYHGLR